MCVSSSLGALHQSATFTHTIPHTSYIPSPPSPPQVRELISGHTSSERNLHSRSAQHLASSEDHQRQVHGGSEERMDLGSEGSWE